VRGERFVVAERTQPLIAEWRPDAHRDRAARTSFELARQHERTQARMNESGNLEPKAVLAGEMHRDHRGASLARQHSYGTTPRRICDASGAHVEVRDLARRKHHDRPVRVEPAQCRTHGLGIAPGALRPEHFDRDQHGLKLGERAQILVRKQLEVRAQRT
jgi:hypothetical protein